MLIFLAKNRNLIYIDATKIQNSILLNVQSDLKVSHYISNKYKVMKELQEVRTLTNIMDGEPANGDNYKSETQSYSISPENLNSPPFDLNIHQDNYVEFLKRINKSPKKSYLLEILQQLLQTDPENDESAIWKNLENIVVHGKNGSKEKVINGPCQMYTEPASMESQQPPPPLLASFSPPPPPPVPLKLSGPLGSDVYTTLKRPALDTSLPQQNPPVPKTKMKIICWDKIPSHEIVGGTNLWTTLATNHHSDSMEYIDWLEAESLFCLQSSSSNNSVLTINRKSKIIKLLDSQRTFNIDILLEQFKGYKSDNDIVQLVYKGNHSAMGSEKISRLIKLLPEAEEIEVLKNFDGNRDCLARAEKFLQQLIDVPSYKLRLECMALKEDFTENAQGLQSSIGQLIQAGKDLMNNRKLHEVLYIIVLVGNFLNTGKYTGKAGGIRVTSLLKLTNIRANANSMNFMHFIADQIKKSHPELINFPHDLQSLAKVNKISIEQLFVDVKKLDLRLQQVRTEIESPATEKDIKQQMISFILKAETHIDILKTGMKNVESMQKQLSEFLCEDSSKFSLSECFNTFQNFAENFTNALNERNEFDLKSTLRLKQNMSNGGDKVSLLAKSEFDVIPESPIVKKRFGKANTESINFIHKEVNTLNKEKKEVKEISKYWRNTQKQNNAHTKIVQRLNGRNEAKVETKDNEQISSNQRTGVSEKIQKYLTNIENGKSANYQQKENKLQENPPRSSSFRLKHQENPSIPKFEKIGKRVSSITEQDLQGIIQKLRRTTKNEPSLWDIPREKLIRHIDCYHAAQDEDTLCHKEVSENQNGVILDNPQSNNLGLPDKSQTNFINSNGTPSKITLNSGDSLKPQEKSKSLFKRFTNIIRFYKKNKGVASNAKD